jgi:hypothetical protein
MDAKIGMFVNSLEGYQGCIVREAKEAAQREGLEVQVLDAQHIAAKQAQDLVRFEHENRGKRSCALVVPEGDAIREGDVASDPTFHLARRLLQKGVGWITLNHGREGLVASLSTMFPYLPIALVAIDNVEFGRTQARQLKALLPRGGMVLCVLGNPLDTASRDRSAGMMEELQGSGITVEELDAHWTESVAETTVHKWITSPVRRKMPLHAVVCQNDPMGAATRTVLVRVADVLGRPELKQVPVIGGDGLPSIGRPWVDDGTLTATVCVTLPGGPAVEHLARYWRDGAPLTPVTRLPVASYPPLGALRPARP